MKDRRITINEDDTVICNGYGDAIHSPNHYKGKNGLESIEVIENFTDNLDGYEGFCTGNIIKYVCRWKKKNGVEDLKKAKKYIDMLIKYEGEK